MALVWMISYKSHNHLLLILNKISNFSWVANYVCDQMPGSVFFNLKKNETHLYGTMCDQIPNGDGLINGVIQLSKLKPLRHHDNSVFVCAYK